MTEEEKKEFEEFLEWKKSKAAAKPEEGLDQIKVSPPPPPTPKSSSNSGNSEPPSTPKNSPNGCLIVFLILIVVCVIWGISKCSSSPDTKQMENIEDWSSDTLLTDFSSDTLEISSQPAKVDTAARIETLKHTVKIKSAYLSSPNSAGGVDAIVYYTNKSKKTIKYLTWEGCAINAVGDMVACDIRNTYYFRGKDTGPVKPGKTSGGNWDCAWYNWTAKKLKLNQIDIEYMDGTTETITESEIKYVR